MSSLSLARFLEFPHSRVTRHFFFSGLIVIIFHFNTCRIIAKLCNVSYLCYLFFHLFVSFIFYYFSALQEYHLRYQLKLKTTRMQLEKMFEETTYFQQNQILNRL